VAVALASSATVTVRTVSRVVGENRLRRTSSAQWPLPAEAATERASFGVKIRVQIRVPSPAIAAACRSLRSLRTDVSSAVRRSVVSCADPPQPPSARTADAATSATTQPRAGGVRIARAAIARATAAA
jgi:hypothetical protein